MPAQLRIADGNGSRSSPRLWNPQDFFNFGFSLTEERCEHTPEPFSTAGKQEILHRWVNRPSTHNRDAMKISVGHRQSIGMKAENTHYWSFAEVLSQVHTGAQHSFSLGPFTLGKRSQSLRVRLHERERNSFVQLTRRCLRGASLTTTTRQAWRLPPVGAQVAASRTRRSTSSGIGSGRNRRTARKVRIAS